MTVLKQPVSNSRFKVTARFVRECVNLGNSTHRRNFVIPRYKMILFITKSKGIQQFFNLKLVVGGLWP